MTTITATTKAWLTLQAEAALAGKVADLIDSDAGQPVLVVTEGPITRQFNNLQDGRAWLDSLREGSHA